MKKIFVLLLAAGSFSSVFAQGYNNKREARDVILGSTSHNKGYNNNSIDKGRKEAIDKINRDYDFQVAAVKRNRYMKSKEKDRQLQRLEKDRTAKIREVYERFSDKRNVYLNKHDGKRS